MKKIIFEEFQEEMKKEIEMNLPRTIEMKEMETMKANFHGSDLVFWPVNPSPTSSGNVTKNATAAPTIHLQTLYESYMSTPDATIESVALDAIKSVRIAIKSANYYANAAEKMQSVAYIRENIYARIINTKENKEYLENALNIPFLDMSIVFSVLLSANTKENETPSAVLNKTLPAIENCSLSDLFQWAKDNMEKEEFPLQANITSMTDILSEMMGTSFPELDPVDEMYIVRGGSSSSGFTTAAGIFSSKLKDLAAELDSDLYILPSSIYEAIAISSKANVAKCNEDDEEDVAVRLMEIVENVNGSEVSQEERLSNNVYIYRKDTDNFEIAACSEAKLFDKF